MGSKGGGKSGGSSGAIFLFHANLKMLVINLSGLLQVYMGQI